MRQAALDRKPELERALDQIIRNLVEWRGRGLSYRALGRRLGAGSCTITHAIRRRA